jgi:surface antigen
MPTELTAPTQEQIVGPAFSEHFRELRAKLGRAAGAILLVAGGVVAAFTAEAAGNPVEAHADTLGYPWPTDAQAPCKFGAAGGASCTDPTPTSETHTNEGSYNWGVYANSVFHPYREGGGYEYRNCTDYTAWKLESLGVSPSDVNNLGNGGKWYDNAPANKRSTTPKAGDAAVVPATSTNPWGHVAFVESVNPDGTITVSEYNYNGQGTGDTRTGNAASMGFTKFVDFGVNPGPVKADPEPWTQGDVKGQIENVMLTPGGVRVWGWVYDPDRSDLSNDVQFYAGPTGEAKPEEYRGGTNANVQRQDVMNAEVTASPYHGFDYTFALPEGEHRICAYSFNVLGTPGKPTRRFSCVDKTRNGQAFGSLENAFQIPGGIRFLGWGFDPDTNEPTQIDLYESETTNPTFYRGGTAANHERNDVRDFLASSYVDVSPNRGLDLNIPFGAGNHHVCGFVANKAGSGGSQIVGCKDVLVSNEPKGWFEGAQWTTGGVAVAGWALDPDTDNPTDIHFYGGDGNVLPQNWAGGLSASGNRPDIVSANPGYNANHGFNSVVPAPAGTSRICAYALNKDGTPGSHLAMGCKSV